MLLMNLIRTGISQTAWVPLTENMLQLNVQEMLAPRSIITKRS